MIDAACNFDSKSWNFHCKFLPLNPNHLEFTEICKINNVHCHKFWDLLLTTLLLGQMRGENARRRGVGNLPSSEEYRFGAAVWRSRAVTQKRLRCHLRAHLGLPVAEGLVLLLKRNGMLCAWQKPLLYLEFMTSDNLDVNIFPLKGEENSVTLFKV